MSRDHIDAGLLLALAVLALLVPYIWSGYEIKLATTITIQAGLAVALGFVVGPAGLVSLGHAAFYGLAAYLFAMLAPASEPANLLNTLLVVVCGTAVCAAVVGAISIRSRGLYFILMTLAFGQLGYIYFRPEVRLPGLDISLDGSAQFYHFVSLIVFAAFALVWWLRRSAFGSLLVAARDNEMRIRAFGYSPYALRLVAFVISGAIAGTMGYLSAAQNGFVAPETLAWHNSATALVMVLIGGKDTTSGPAIGAILLLLAEELLQRATEHWLIGIGLIIVVIVIAAPQGIVPYLARLFPARRAQDA